MPDRRETLSWLMRALALSAAPTVPLERAAASMRPRPARRRAARDTSAARGYGRDPNLLDPHFTWPLTLGAERKSAVALLADVFLPADGASPPASRLGVQDFVDEWISAPYPQQQNDRVVVLAGLTDLERESGGPLHELDAARARELVAGLQSRATAGEPAAARFFSRFRRICLIGYYTTPAGVAELGYVGYQPSVRFAGPPREVLAKLGV